MKILIATDGSEFGKRAVEMCCLMLPLQEAAIKVISAAENAAAVSMEPLVVSAGFILKRQALQLEQANKSVQEAKETIVKRFPDSNVETSVYTHSFAPAAAIVEEAEIWGADLIVIGSHGYGFWSRALLGSVS